MITFGTHYLLTIDQQERERVRTFYTTLLGCALHSADDGGVTNNIPPNVDLFEFAGHEVVGVQYVDDPSLVLTQRDSSKSCWTWGCKKSPIFGIRSTFIFMLLADKYID